MFKLRVKNYNYNKTNNEKKSKCQKTEIKVIEKKKNISVLILVHNFFI